MGEVQYSITFDFQKGQTPSFDAMRERAKSLSSFPPAIAKGWLYLDTVGNTTLADWGTAPDGLEEEGQRPLTLENLKLGIIEEIDSFEQDWEDFQTSSGSTKFWLAGAETESVAGRVINLMTLEILDAFGCSRAEATCEYESYEEKYPNPLPYTERPHVQLRHKEEEEASLETQKLVKENPTVWDFAQGPIAVGDRVVAVRGDFSITGEVHIFGHGVYEGDFIPPGQNTPNPRILLDSGETVWGMECWWGPEKNFAPWVGKRKVFVNLRSAPIAATDPKKSPSFNRDVWGDLFR